LVAGPLTGFRLLALRAVAVAAGAMNEMLLAAIGTLIKRGAQGTGATGQQGFKGVSFQERQRVLGLIIGLVGADDIG
jgi:hypothetical protein